MMKNSLFTLFCILSQLVTAQNMPDLTLANLNVANANVPQGQVLYYKFDLKNMGTGNAHGSFSVKAYLSRDAYLSADDIQDGIVPTANFAAGFSVSQVQGASTVRNPIGTGNYYLILKVDADNSIAESNENNNLLVFAPITVTPVNTNSCRYQDSLQLVNLYYATNGANWATKWNLNTPMPTWFGVTLNPAGCVESVYLNNNNLVGTIPPLNMPELIAFMVSNNQLKGSIPNFNLPKLAALVLSGNQFTGAISNFNMPKLFILHLENNQLSGSIPNFNMPHLRDFYLSLNQLTGTIPNFNMPHLEIIDFQSNQLTGTIPNFNFQKLQLLFLQNNRLSGVIPNFNLAGLRALYLSNNQLTGNIPHLNTPQLLFLYLTSNQLSGCLPRWLRSICGRVQHINISNNPGLINQDIHTFCNANVGACVPNLPDLTLSNLNLTQNTVQQNQILNYRFDLKNIGNAAASGSFNVKSYISRDNILSSDDVPDGIVPTGNFAAGFSVSQVAGASRMRSPIGTGQYYLILKADADNQIAESNENNNLLVSLPFRVTPHSETICLNQFDIQGDLARECGTVNTIDSWGSLQQYGSHIEEGFLLALSQHRFLYQSFHARFYARNGVATPQWGSKYRNCPGNWVYFTAEGVQVAGARQFSETVEYSKVYMRVRTVGNASNPDNLHIEFDSATNLNFETRLWWTIQKSQNCNPCFATDQTPPIITGCPTTPIVDIRISGDRRIFVGGLIREQLGLQFSDNCPLNPYSQYVVPSYAVAQLGDILPIKFIRFDSAGNKAVCETRLRFVSDSSSPTYCASKGNIPWNEWIAGVQFSNLNNPNTKQGYADFTGATANVIRGSSYTFTLTQGYSWATDPSNATAQWRVWIDYNQNNIFDADELAASGTHTTSTATITIPLTASLGNTRMRVSLKKTGAPTACEVFEKGEVEDYTVNIANSGGYEKIQNIENQSVTNFNIFPNPAQGEVFLDLKDFENQKVEISLSDVAGKAIWNQTIENATASPHRLDVSKLKNGAYLIHIQSVTRKIARTLYILN